MDGSDRAKHIDLHCHFIHEAVKNGILTLRVVNSLDNVADLLIKHLQEPAFKVLRKRMIEF